MTLGNRYLRASMTDLLSLIPVDACILGLPAHGDKVNSAVAIQVGRRQVLDCDATGFDDLPAPAAAALIEGSVDANAARFLAPLVANADDQLLIAVAIQIGGRHGMAPFELVIDHVTIP